MEPFYISARQTIDPDWFEPSCHIELDYHIDTPELVVLPTDLRAVSIDLLPHSGRIILWTQDVEWLKLVLRNWQDTETERDKERGRI